MFGTIFSYRLTREYLLYREIRNKRKEENHMKNKNKNTPNEIKFDSSIFKWTLVGITVLTISISLALNITNDISSTIQVTKSETKRDEVNIYIQPMFCIGANACNPK